ncbi:MAG: anion permease [Candidatus Rhabdochlamydia sp.]|jgi:PiT family inorganic phosphate transporter|nr:inorganic phosphate transporter, PiT family [Chlamydiota bacterium]
MDFALVICIVVLGLAFDYTNGFHDAANVVSTVIATRVLTPLVAICMASILNVIGATQISGVAQTIASGLVDPNYTSSITIIAALLGAIIWNVFTWSLGIPSSSSYALIGGLIGSVWAQNGLQAIYWYPLMKKVVIPMVLSPLMGCLFSFSFLKILQFFIKRFDKFTRLFACLQIVSSALVALAHGLNDAQKSMGIITLGLFSAGIISTDSIPLWVILSCALVIGVGTASGGFRVIRTVGFRITHLKSYQGFAAESSSSLVILLASFLGMPISSTQMIVGSITGVGLAKEKPNVQWKTARRLVLTWILTLPLVASFSCLIFMLFKVFI